MRKLFFTAASLFLAGQVYAQQPMVGCVNQAMRVQAEQIKRDFRAQGFVAIKDMMLTMKSRESIGVSMPMSQGKLYQLIYIGSKDASSLNFELYDGGKFRIDERKLDNPAENSLLVYSFMPEKTDTFVVALTQNLKEKSTCGSFTVLRQDEIPQPKKPAPVKPAANKK